MTRTGVPFLDRKDQMKAIEMFESARLAATEIKRIEARTQEMLDRIGVQGHGYEHINITGVLDPMRKVDDLLDWESRAKEELSECEREIAIGWQIVAGIDALGFGTHARVLSGYYLEARSWESVSKETGLTPDECRGFAKTACDVCDAMGIAKVKEMGRG